MTGLDNTVGTTNEMARDIYATIRPGGGGNHRIYELNNARRPFSCDFSNDFTGDALLRAVVHRDRRS